MVRDSVLLVDDEPQVLVALEDILCDAFDVVKTECAEQALSVAKRRSDIAVVVTDQRMPQTQGDELASLLSGFSDATRILLTGYADISAVIRAVNEGQIFAYVAKPWSVDDLLHKVHKAAERFHMVRELARERQMLHDLMSSVPDGIFFKDVDLRFTRLNDAHAALSNAAGAETLIGRRLRDFRPQDEEALRIEEEERAVLAGTAAVDVVRRERIGDEQRWISESKAVILGQTGEPIGLVGIARDITERKLQEARIARLTRIQAMSSAINAGIVRTNDRQRAVRRDSSGGAGGRSSRRRAALRRTGSQRSSAKFTGAPHAHRRRQPGCRRPAAAGARRSGDLPASGDGRGRFSPLPLGAAS
jgi:PAS domain S-box-containing protein